MAYSEIDRLRAENENLKTTRQLAWDAARRLCRAVWEFHGNHTYQNREQLVKMALWLNRNINDAEAYFATFQRSDQPRYFGTWSKFQATNLTRLKCLDCTVEYECQSREEDVHGTKRKGGDE